MRLLTIAIIFCILLGTAIAPSPAVATNTQSDQIDYNRIDRYITAQMSKHGLKGISLAITEGEKIVYLQGYGTAGQGREMTPQTPMYIGSQSKSITSLAIAQLAEQGKVKLNDPVIKYIPWFKVSDAQATVKITVGNLLYHTSGLSDAGYTAFVPDNASLEEGIRSLVYAKLTAPVGQKFQYFNMGYCVLMQVIENTSGEIYSDYVQHHIFSPLGMDHTYTDPASARADGLSQGYSRLFGFTIPWPQPHLAYQLGDGYLISTAEDLAHFAIAMNNQGVYLDQRIISAAMLRQIFTPVNGYGMGWFIMPDHINHGGANETFKTFVDLYPSHNLGLVLLINQGYMIDHYVSAEQVFKGIEALALGLTPPPIAQGWSVRTIGSGLLVLVFALCILHTWNFLHLRKWKINLPSISEARRILGVSISFIIPSLILIIIYCQVRNFFGYRFNLTYQMVMMYKALPDISILLIIGIVPDYIQGFIKLAWAIRG